MNRLFKTNDKDESVLIADHSFLDFSDLKSGFKPSGERAFDSNAAAVSVCSGYGEVYFAGNTIDGFAVCTTVADTHTHYGDNPEEKKPDYTDPAICF